MLQHSSKLFALTSFFELLVDELRTRHAHFSGREESLAEIELLAMESPHKYALSGHLAVSREVWKAHTLAESCGRVLYGAYVLSVKTGTWPELTTKAITALAPSISEILRASVFIPGNDTWQLGAFFGSQCLTGLEKTNRIIATTSTKNHYCPWNSAARVLSDAKDRLTMAAILEDALDVLFDSYAYDDEFLPAVKLQLASMGRRSALDAPAAARASVSRRRSEWIKACL